MTDGKWTYVGPCDSSSSYDDHYSLSFLVEESVGYCELHAKVTGRSSNHLAMIESSWQENEEDRTIFSLQVGKVLANFETVSVDELRYYFTPYGDSRPRRGSAKRALGYFERRGHDPLTASLLAFDFEERLRAALLALREEVVLRLPRASQANS